MANVNKRAKVAEVLIIGAGASGSVAAKHLAEAGVDVVCLEQGPKVDNSELWGDKPEWELMAEKRWHPNPNVRDLENDYPIDTSESDVNPLMYNAVGGSTILYAAHSQLHAGLISPGDLQLPAPRRHRPSSHHQDLQCSTTTTSTCTAPRRHLDYLEGARRTPAPPPRSADRHQPCRAQRTQPRLELPA